MTLLGPIIGGLLVDNLTWRLAFLINVPLVVIALWAALRHVEELRDPDAGGHFDWVGSVVGALAVGGLAFGAVHGQETHWADSVAWLSLGVGVVCLALFPILMARRPHPLVPLSLFRNREFAAINLATFLIYGALYVSFTYTALVYQGTLGYTATGAAIIGLPSGILLATLSARIGGLTARFGSRLFLVAGPLIVGAGQLWLARIPASSAPWLADLAKPSTLVPPADALIDVLPATVAFGLGMAMVVAPLDEHAHELHPVAELRARLGDQQRPVAGRPAARRRGDLHRDHGVVLLGAGIPRSGPRRERPDGSRRDRAPQPAEAGHASSRGRRMEGRIRRRLPPRGTRLGRLDGRRRSGVGVRASIGCGGEGQRAGLRAGRRRRLRGAVARSVDVG